MLLDAIKINENTYIVGSDLGLGSACCDLVSENNSAIQSYRIMRGSEMLNSPGALTYPCLVVLSYTVGDSLSLASAVALPKLNDHLLHWQQRGNDQRLTVLEMEYYPQ